MCVDICAIPICSPPFAKDHIAAPHPAFADRVVGHQGSAGALTILPATNGIGTRRSYQTGWTPLELTPLEMVGHSDGPVVGQTRG